MKTRSLYLLTALVGAVAFTVPWLMRIAAQDSPIGSYSMSEWAHYQLNVNRTLETGTVGKVVGYTASGTIGVLTDAGGLPEAPLGTSLYARSNALWQAFPPGLATMQTDAPDNGLWYSRRNGEWQNFLPGGGSGTNVGGTNRLKLAALAEFRPPATNGTLLPANTATFIRVNHIFDPDGIFTGVDTNAGSFRLAAGYYAITMVVPVSVAETGGGNVRIPFTIGLFNLTTADNVYYQTYTVYDEDLSQYSQVFLPALVTDGLQDYSIQVFNHSTTLDLVAGQAGNVAGLENHYTEIQFLKIDGIAGLEDAPVNTLKYARSNANWVSFTIPSTNGFIHEAPTDGQTYGRRGSDASWQLATGGGGADTNAVAAVPDLATLTNTVVGYSKAIVGGSTDYVQKLYQRVSTGTALPSSDWVVAGLNQSITTNPDGSKTCTGTGANQYVGIIFSDNGIGIGEILTIKFTAKANETSLLDLYGWLTGITVLPTINLGTSYVNYSMQGTAANVDALFAGRADATDNGDSITVLSASYSIVPGFEFENPNGTTVLASAAEPGYGWKFIGDIYPDALSDGQTYGRKDGAWAVMTGGAAQTTNQVSVPNTGYDSSYQFLPTANTILVTAVSDPAYDNITFDSKPVILPGVEGQYLIITNGTLSTLRFPRHTNPTPTESGIWSPTSVYFIGPGYVGYFRFRTDGGLWDAYGTWPIVVTGLEATLLPAPWDPPDEDGNQTIRDDVQDALIDALLPRLLDRLGLSAGTLPAPAPAPRRLGKPGTRANPIDWPAAPEPAAAAGKYNINIQIGDQ